MVWLYAYLVGAAVWLVLIAFLAALTEETDGMWRAIGGAAVLAVVWPVGCAIMLGAAIKEARK